jgi:hypothetical protein
MLSCMIEKGTDPVIKEDVVSSNAATPILSP